MQDRQTPFPVGTTIRGRYIIEDVIGKGNSGVVYLVRDARDQQSLFILKEVEYPGGKNLLRIRSDSIKLRRLDHPALPRVHHLFKSDKRGQAYLLVDYIEGPDLETVRQLQPEKGFSLPEVMTLMAPIIDAVTYLHSQHPPLIHGDITPSNIILPGGSKSPVLVDFGLAGEYTPVLTTNAAHSGSSAYRAPEQYDGDTGPWTDIYALGAILYLLLTDIVPPNTRVRLIQLGNGQPDPLLPMDQVTPAIPTTVARTIHRTLSIQKNDRFSSVEQLWEALWQVPDAHPWTPQAREPASVAPLSECAGSEAQLVRQQMRVSVVMVPPEEVPLPVAHPTMAEQPSIPVVMAPPEKSPLLVVHSTMQPTPAPVVTPSDLPRTLVPQAGQKQPAIRRLRKSGWLFLTLFALFVILLTGIGIGLRLLSSTTDHSRSGSVRPTSTRQVSQASPHPTTSSPSPITSTLTPASPSYSQIAARYVGTLHDIPTNTTANISLTGIQQQQGNISGYFGGMSGNSSANGIAPSGPFMGTVNAAEQVQFTVTPATGQSLFYFEGQMQLDGSMGGSYCRPGAVRGTCSYYGVWSASPGE